MEKLNIKRGKSYICYNIEFDTFMFEKGKILGFTVGNVYTSHKDGYLKNDDGLEMTFFSDAAKFFKEYNNGKDSFKRAF